MAHLVRKDPWNADECHVVLRDARVAPHLEQISRGPNGKGPEHYRNNDELVALEIIGVEQAQGDIRRELERRVPPEFLNWIDEVVLFAQLTHDETREIAKHYLARVKLVLNRSGKTIRIDHDALELSVAQGHSLAYGARFLKRVIDERIKLPISARWREGSHFHVRVRGGDVAVEPAPELLRAADKA
jgi:ATP-dependent Clp protease ATP-binding subunit ClpA